MDLHELVTFGVSGKPEPQGSKSAIVRNGRALIVEGRRSTSRRRFEAWRRAVTAAARAAWVGRAPLSGPVAITCDFRFARPKTHYRISGGLRPSAPAHRVARPDLDKLIRAVLDSITAAHLWGDDSQVVKTSASKSWAPTDGVSISIFEVAS